MSDLSLSVLPGYNWVTGEVLTIAKLQLAALPVITLSGTISTASIADGSVTKNKIDTSLAGDGLVGGAGTALSVVLDNVTLQFDAGVIKVKDNSITPSKIKQDAYAYATGTFTTDTYAVTLSPVPASYITGMVVRFKASAANVGGGTKINVNTLGDKALKKVDGSALNPGDIPSGAIVECFYDGTNFQIESLKPVQNIGITGNVKGLIVQPNGAAASSKIDITADELWLKASGLGYLATSVSLTVDITTSGANGLDTGAEAASTWYYAWVIYDGTTVAGLLSASSTAPTLPANYTYKALVGCVRNNGSSNFVSFYQAGRDVIFADTVIGNAKTYASSWNVISGADLTAFQAAIPPIAVQVNGTMGSATGASAVIGVASDANGLGGMYANITRHGDFFSYGACAPFRIALKANSIAVQSDNSAGRCRITISGFTLP